MKSLIILDRDGCINVRPREGEYVAKVDQFQLYPDALDCISRLLKRKLKVCIATNQRGIAKGLYGIDEVFAMHLKLRSLLGVSNEQVPIFICPHEINTCDCRKPKPGLLNQALTYFGCLTEEAIFIGDSESDYEAAKSISMDFVQLSRDESLTLSIRNTISSLDQLPALIDEFSG